MQVNLKSPPYLILIGMYSSNNCLKLFLLPHSQLRNSIFILHSVLFVVHIMETFAYKIIDMLSYVKHIWSILKNLKMQALPFAARFLNILIWSIGFDHDTVQFWWKYFRSHILYFLTPLIRKELRWIFHSYDRQNMYYQII